MSAGAKIGRPKSLGWESGSGGGSGRGGRRALQKVETRPLALDDEASEKSGNRLHAPVSRSLR